MNSIVGRFQFFSTFAMRHLQIREIYLQFFNEL
jgi:hypothetical protein